MFWYKVDRLLGYILNLSILGYVLWDGYIKFTKSESFIVNILVIFIMSAYNVVIQRLNRIVIATEYVGSYFAVKQLQEKSVGDFEKLLNDFGNSEWKLDR